MRSVYPFNDDLETGKIDNTEKVYYCQTCHLFFRLYIPQKAARELGSYSF